MGLSFTFAPAKGISFLWPVFFSLWLLFLDMLRHQRPWDIPCSRKKRHGRRSFLPGCALFSLILMLLLFALAFRIKAFGATVAGPIRLFSHLGWAFSSPGSFIAGKRTGGRWPDGSSWQRLPIRCWTCLPQAAWGAPCGGRSGKTGCFFRFGSYGCRHLKYGRFSASTV